MYLSPADAVALTRELALRAVWSAESTSGMCRECDGHLAAVKPLTFPFEYSG